MLDNVVCPLSFRQINRNVVRINGFVTTLALVAYAVTGWAWIIVPVAFDYGLRAMMDGPTSPMTHLARFLWRVFRLPHRAMDKAPKVFASRIGVCFATGAAVTHFVAPGASPWLAGILAAFTTLESVFDLCVGCVVYHYLVLPLYRARDAVKSIALFSRLDDRSLAEVARGFHEVEYPEGRQILVEGDPGNELFVLKHGRVEVFHVLPDGGRSVIATYGPRDHFGEMSLLTGEPRNASVRAIEPVVALRLDRAEFERVLDRHPGMRKVLEGAARERLAFEAVQA